MLLGGVLADCLEALFHSDNVAERESLASALYAVASASASHVGFVQLFSIRREQGRTLGLESDDGSIRVPEPNAPGASLFMRSSRWQLPFAFAEQRALDKARVAFEQAARELDELPAENSRNSRLMAISMLSEVAAIFRAREPAEDLLALTTPYVDQWVVVGFGAQVGISVQAVRANLFAALGAWDEAAAHYERAVAEHDREGAAVVQARTLHAHARMLLTRGRAADRRRAATVIERGRRIADAAGLAASAAKLARLQERLASGAHTTA